ncbi:hypothetical protein [Helicobacter pylori]|uniref:hypothetical protein n=1 Tax=Helicobacter pylori TaxID=210 RepID=UPI001FD5C9F7|nr:hypothetical protein [Helicobacter pylori]UOS54518.1 hypothetical protein MPG03_03865 [Helicobacter pylori]
MHGFLLLSCQIAPIKPIFMAIDKTNVLSNINNLSNNATFNPMLSSGLREFFSIAWTERATLFQRLYHIRHNRMHLYFFL